MSGAARVQVLELRGSTQTVPTRMPFRFGNAVMEAMDVLTLEATVSVSGAECAGTAASVLSPLWFDKDPARSLASKDRALRRAVELAREAAVAAPAATPFELHRAVAAAVQPAARAAGLNELTAGFGVALVDLVVADAVCGAAGVDLHGALRRDLLGCGPQLAAALPAHPARSIAVRHTVGLTDPLTAAEQAERGQRLDDGLPETLEEVIARYGVRWFKVKTSGDAEASLERLRRIAAVLDRAAPKGYRVTLDGNESFAAMADVAAFARAAAADAALANLWRAVEWIEQPVPRDRALDAGVAAPLAEVQRLKPVILDESDAADGVLAAAWALGYSGVSAKSCKGLYRTLQHVLFLAAHRTPQRPGILASEDLTCPPLAALHQDLAIDAALGLAHTERNAHHYLRGLDHLPPAERRAARERYPMLYEQVAPDLIALRIRDGKLALPQVW